MPSEVARAKALTTEARELVFRLARSARSYDDAHDATGDPAMLAKANRCMRLMMRAARRQSRRFDRWWELRKEARP